MQAISTKKPSFKCPTFTVPSKGKETTNETKLVKDVGEKSSTTVEEGKLDEQEVNATGDAKTDEAQNSMEESLEPAKDGSNTGKLIDSTGDATQVEIKKKVVKKKPAFLVKQKEGEAKDSDGTEKAKKEKKAKIPKELKERKQKEPKQPKEPKEKKEKAPKNPKEPKEKKEKAPKNPALPVRSLTNEEYEAIFSAALESVLAINIEEWKPKETSPVIVKPKKKYSILSRKPAPEMADTPDLESDNEKDMGKEENEIQEAADKGEIENKVKISDGLDGESDDGNDKKGHIDLEEDIHDDDQENNEVDENNNDIVMQNDDNMEQDNESVDNVQHQNETTPEGSELDYGTTPAPAPAPACASPPAKKKASGIRKKKKLEPKSLSFSDKEQMVIDAEKTEEENKVKLAKVTEKVNKTDVVSTEHEQKRKMPATSKDKYKGTPVKEKIKKLKQMVKELEQPSKKRKVDDGVHEKKQKTDKKIVDKVDDGVHEKKQKTDKKIVDKVDDGVHEKKQKTDKKIVDKVDDGVHEKKQKTDKKIVDKVDDGVHEKKQKTDKKIVDSNKETGTHSKLVRKQSKKAQMLTRKIAEEGTWVQCCNSGCLKWRHLPDISDPSEVPERWVCKMNTREEFNSCDKPEEKYDESEHIYTKFTEGSVVWAKISGWPWWPAMVEIDPDAETYFDASEANTMIPTHYHVVFFDEKVSRAWVKTDSVRLFTGSEEADNIKMIQVGKKGPSYIKEISLAKKNAIEALQYSLQERIQMFGFAKRFHGKWGNRTDEYTFVDSNETTKREKKRKVKCREDKKRKPKQHTSDLLDDDEIESVINNTESLLDNVEEVLGSLDSDIEDSEEESDFVPEEVLPKKKRKFEEQDKQDTVVAVKKSKVKQLESEPESDIASDKEEYDIAFGQEDDIAAPKMSDISEGGKSVRKENVNTNEDNVLEGAICGSVSPTKEVHSQCKTDAKSQKETENIKFDPEIFTMEMDEDVDNDKLEIPVIGVDSTQGGKSSENATGKSKTFKDPAASKNKKVKASSKNTLKPKHESDCDEEKVENNDFTKDNISIGNHKNFDSVNKDNERSNNKDEGKASHTCDKLNKLDQDENILAKYNKSVNLSSDETDQVAKDLDDKAASDDELDLATEVPDINSQERVGNKEQDSNEDSEDDFDLIEKSMYDNDLVQEKVRDMEVVNVTVLHSQDSDSDPFDMMVEE